MRVGALLFCGGTGGTGFGAGIGSVIGRAVGAWRGCLRLAWLPALGVVGRKAKAPADRQGLHSILYTLSSTHCLRARRWRLAWLLASGMVAGAWRGWPESKKPRLIARAYSLSSTLYPLRSIHCFSAACRRRSGTRRRW